MNASSNRHIEPAADISALILRAVSGSGQWRQVLEAVMAATGASVGVISLREHDSAGLYFPESAPVELAAPLIVGIPPEHVASYFEHFSAIDPWTGIEHANHPYAPYFMSEHLPLEDLQTSEFYAGWLQPQRISECLVAEVYSSERYWVAINLLFDHVAFSRHQEILARMAVVLPVMRTGWELSERLLGLTTSQVASRGYLESWPYPCVILDQDLVVTSANKLGLSEFPRHLTLSAPLDVGATLELDGGPVSEILDRLRRTTGIAGAVSGVLKAPSECKGYTLEISPVIQETDVLGKRRAHFVVLAKA